jgi:hypothetical protein
LRTIIDLEEHLRSDSRELDVVNFEREQHKIEGIRSVLQERGNRCIAAPRSGWGGWGKYGGGANCSGGFELLALFLLW